MTREEFEKVPFKLTGHVSMVHQHTITYANRQYGFKLVCSTAVKKDGSAEPKEILTYVEETVVDEVVENETPAEEVVEEVVEATEENQEESK